MKTLSYVKNISATKIRNGFTFRQSEVTKFDALECTFSTVQTTVSKYTIIKTELLYLEN